MSKKQWYEIIKICTTAILAVASTLLVQSCTLSLSVQKNNSGSMQTTEQTSTSSVDSTSINLQK